MRVEYPYDPRQIVIDNTIFYTSPFSLFLPLPAPPPLPAPASSSTPPVHDAPSRKAMARDLKVNYNQLTLGQLRRMCNTLLSLGGNQRVAAVPERALKAAAAAAGGSSGGALGCKKAPPAVAMEVAGAGSDAGGVAAQEESREKGKGKKKKKASE